MKKATFKTLSILLAAVILVAALHVTAFAEDVSPSAIRPCEHNYVTRDDTTYVPVSDTAHLTTPYIVESCIWCGAANIFQGEPYFESHTYDVSYYKTYLYVCNEYHWTTEYEINTCVCGDTLVEQGASYSEWHEFDDSVDEEVDMNGVCIRCGEEVSW